MKSGERYDARTNRRLRRAVWAQQRGDLHRAIQEYKNLVDTHPDFPDAWHYLGLAEADTGNFESSKQALDRALSLDPENAKIHVHYSRILSNTYEHEQAIERARIAWTLAPEDDDIFIQYSMVLLAAELGDELLPDLNARIATARDGILYKLLLLQMSAYAQSGYRDEALESARRAAELAPESEEAHLQVYDASVQLNDYDAARSALKKAFAAAPDSPDVLMALAGECAVNGKFTISRHLARRALRKSGYRKHAAWLLLSGTKKDEELKQLGGEIAKSPPPENFDREGFAYYFALGKALEAEGRYAEAYQAFSKGNEIQSRFSKYSDDKHSQWLTSLIKDVDGDLTSRIESLLDDACTEAPIFVCGMPRSGTTLTESVLGAHGGVMQGGELLIVHDALRRHLGCRNLPRVGQAIRGMDDAELGALARELHEGYARRRRGFRFITDKLPSHCELAGLLLAFFPRSKVIHVKRDPLDNCLSCYLTPFAEGNVFSNRIEDLVAYYLGYRKIMRNWREVLDPVSFREYQYEELVDDLEKVSRDLYEFCGLDWSPDVARTYTGSRMVRTSSFYQVRKPVYSSSIGRATNYPSFVSSFNDIWPREQVL